MKLLKSIFLFGLFVLTLSNAWADNDDRESDDKSFSQAELEQILAPVALYPDTMLSHVLIAATYPLEVIQAERWTAKNPDIKGNDAVQAVENKDWDPSVKALTAFPQVLKRMSENLEWTQKLGDAFLQDEKAVLASVQSLRQKAYEAGNLDKMDKVSVSHEDNTIIIQPIEREVVYVPYYDTRVVYGPWYWSHYPPVYWYDPYYDNHYYGRHHGPFYWGPRIDISFGFYFSAFHWHNHHVVRIPYNYYRPGHYYSHHDIINYQYTRAWSHNPIHRRGVSYRSVSVSNRYQSNRLSRAEIHQNRNGRHADGRAQSRTGGRNSTSIANRRGANQRANPASNNSRRNHNSRIATPDRIREELKDGRISVKERNNRPRTKPATQNSHRENRSHRNRESRGDNSRSNESRNRSSGGRRSNHRESAAAESSPVEANPVNSSPAVNSPQVERKPVEGSSQSALRRDTASRSNGGRSSASSHQRSSRSSDSNRSSSRSSSRSSNNRSSSRSSRSSRRGNHR